MSEQPYQHMSRENMNKITRKTHYDVDAKSRRTLESQKDYPSNQPPNQIIARK